MSEKELLFVVPGFKGSLSTMKGKLLSAMDRIEDGDFPDDRLKRFREQGKIASGREIEAAAVVEQKERPDPVTSSGRVPTAPELAPGEVRDLPEPRPGTDRRPPSSPSGEGQGKWRFSAEMLEGRTLDQLNVAIHEIDPKVQPFDTVEEASAWLSQDLRS